MATASVAYQHNHDAKLPRSPTHAAYAHSRAKERTPHAARPPINAMCRACYPSSIRSFASSPPETSSNFCSRSGTVRRFFSSPWTS